MNLPNVHSVRDITNLRKLIDDIDINLRSVKSLGLVVKEYGALLNPLVMGKLPEEIRIEVTKELNGKEWQLSTVLEILKSELGAKEQRVQLVSHKHISSKAPHSKLSYNLCPGKQLAKYRVVFAKGHVPR